MFEWEQLEPSLVWKNFGQLVAIPRPSKGEAQAREWVKAWAAERSFRTTEDNAGNVVIFVPARGTASSAAPVILQGHLDIVVADDHHAPEPVDSANAVIPVMRGRTDEKRRFIPDPEGDWVGAPWTTLGADNGIGCAMGLAIAEDLQAIHPPLELLFTTDEEQGMTGALGLDPDALQLQGRTLINLDTEDDDELTIGCAGGMDVAVRYRATWNPPSPDALFLVVTLKGLRGGHSGVEIHQGRANANRVLARALRQASDSVPLQIASIHGGEKRNAIPRFAEAILQVAPGSKAALQSALDAAAAALSPLYEGRDEPIVFDVATAEDSPPTVLTAEDSTRLLELLVALPDGVFAMTAEIPDLVETSNNVAIIERDGDDIVIHCNCRSSFDAGMDDVADTIGAAAAMAGGTATSGGRYPGWKPDLHSPLLELTTTTYEGLFGESPHVSAIHAGLECGVLAGKLPGLDAISFGPNIRGVHAPGEHVQIPSVAKSYRLLQTVLQRLASTT